MRASVAVVLALPLVSHTQNGSHVSSPTAVRRMNKQSLATGCTPEVMGCPQSPRSADAGIDTAVRVRTKAASPSRSIP
jgi:hypothetical protein